MAWLWGVACHRLCSTSMRTTLTPHLVNFVLREVCLLYRPYTSLLSMPPRCNHPRKQPSTRRCQQQQAACVPLGPRRKHYFPVLHPPLAVGDAPLLELTTTYDEATSTIPPCGGRQRHCLPNCSSSHHQPLTQRSASGWVILAGHIWYTRTPAGPDHPTDASRLLSSRAYPCDNGPPSIIRGPALLPSGAYALPVQPAVCGE